MAKHSINLLQADLIPAQPLWTLNRVVAAWGVTLAVMLLWVVISEVLLSSAQSEQKKLSAINANAKAQVQKLESAVKNHKPSTKLLAELDKLKLLIANKSFLEKQLTDPTQTYVAGFSSAMTELSELHHRDISLSKVSINTEQLVFSGVARKPNVVPAWLAGFENSEFLSGKRFVNFSLKENEQNFIEFTVSSQPSAEEVQ